MQGGLDRDRDSAGRARNARPRDDLGRPLGRGTAPPPPPDEPSMSPQDALVRAQELLDSGRAFAAHEVFEAVWKATDGDDRALWRGLAQLAVAITHEQRGNTRGASALFRRAAATLADVGADRHGVAVDALRAWARTRAADPAGERPPMPRLAESGQAADDRA